MSHWKSWLLAAVLAVVLEVLPPSTHFFFLCVALGALAASISAFFTTSATLSWICFVVVTAAFTPFLMPLARFLFDKRAPSTDPTTLTGQRAVVEQPVSGSRAGTVTVRGELWQALSAGENFQPRDEVQISGVDGDHLIVRRPS